MILIIDKLIDLWERLGCTFTRVEFKHPLNTIAVMFTYILRILVL